MSAPRPPLSSGGAPVSLSLSTRWISLSFLFLALFFYADKWLLGPYAPIRVHDSFDGEFARIRTAGAYFWHHGFHGWYPPLAGGSPAYAHHFAPFYPLGLLAQAMPDWLINSTLLILFMFAAGYGMWLFLRACLGLAPLVCLAGGVLFALNTQIQGDSLVHCIFSFTFPLFFMWAFKHDFAAPRSLLRSAAALGMLLVSFPVLSAPFYSSLSLFLLVVFREPGGRGLGRALVSWFLVWTGYSFFFAPDLYALYEMSRLGSRTYVPNQERFLPSLRFWFLEFSSKSLLTPVLCGALLSCWGRGRARLWGGLTVGLTVFTAFLYSSASNFLLGTFLMKMDLMHFSWLLPFLMTVFACAAAADAWGDGRRTFLLALGGLVGLACWSYVQDTRFYTLLAGNLLVWAGVMTWLSFGIRPAAARKGLWRRGVLVLFVLSLVLAARVSRVLLMEYSSYHRYFGLGEDLRALLKDTPSRVGTLQSPPALALSQGLETVDGRSPIFYGPYKKYFGLILENQFQTPAEKKAFEDYWYNLYLLEGNARERFRQNQDPPLGWNLPLLLAANVSHIIAPRPVAELAALSSEVVHLSARPPAWSPAFLHRFLQPFPLYVYRLRDSFPRAYLADKADVLETDQAVLEKLSQAGLEALRHTVYLSKQAQEGKGAADAPFPGSTGGGAVEWRWKGPDKVEITARSEGPKYLVVSNNFHPRWTASVDGEPTAIYRANHAFQAVYLASAGEHKVILEFVDPWLWRLQAAVLLGIVLMWWGLRRRPRPSPVR